MIDEVGALLTEECWSKSPRRGGEQDKNWTNSLKFGEGFYVKEAEEKRVNSISENERRRGTSPRRSSAQLICDDRDE